MTSSASLRDLPPIGTIGRYQVLGRLAVGGMAEIFLAFEEGPRQTRRYVVIKRILPHVAEDAAYVDSFEQEAALSMRLRHPNICTVYEFGRDRGTYFLAMEYVHGVPLNQVIAKVGPFPIPLAARLMADVASALGHAHQLKDESGLPLGIVHRDVTPDNLMIGFDGQIKLLDFGIAKAATQVQKTKAGVLKGKVAYMSPEQYKGEAVDGRSDLFSLGATFYEALTGTNPFDRGSEANTVAAVLFEDPPNLVSKRPDAPEALNDLVVSLLSKDPGKRAASAEGLARELDAWLAGSRAMVRADDIAAFLEAAFPQRKTATPDLSRTPLGPDKPDPVVDAAMGAELDDIVEQTEKAARRKRVMVTLLAVLLVLAAGGAVAWKVMTSSRL